MKIFSRIFLLLAAITLLAWGCKKGGAEPGGDISGNTFSESKTERDFSLNKGEGLANTFAGGQQGTGGEDEEEEEEEEEEQPPPTPTVTNTLVYKSATYNSVSVICQATADYFGMSASNGSPSFTCTLYFAARPAVSDTYDIESIATSSPSAGSAWLVVQDGGTTYLANTGTIDVTVTGTAVKAVFSGIVVESGSTTQTISGSVNCL